MLRIAEAADDVQVEALISDFGLAKDMKMKERTLSQVGSVDWMAPEVIMGKHSTLLTLALLTLFIGGVYVICALLRFKHLKMCKSYFMGL